MLPHEALRPNLGCGGRPKSVSRWCHPTLVRALIWVRHARIHDPSQQTALWSNLLMLTSCMTDWKDSDKATCNDAIRTHSLH